MMMIDAIIFASSFLVCYQNQYFPMKDHISLCATFPLWCNEDGNFLFQTLIALHYIFNIFLVPWACFLKIRPILPDGPSPLCFCDPLALEITIFCYDTKQLLRDAH
jgi:hypothetical protein